MQLLRMVVPCETTVFAFFCPINIFSVDACDFFSNRNKKSISRKEGEGRRLACRYFGLRLACLFRGDKDNNREIRPTNGAFLQTMNEFWGQWQQKCCKNGRNSNSGGKMWQKKNLYKKMGLLKFEVSWKKTFEDGGRT